MAPILRPSVGAGVEPTCPGTGRGRLYTREEIERSARETEDWYEGEAGR